MWLVIKEYGDVVSYTDDISTIVCAHADTADALVKAFQAGFLHCDPNPHNMVMFNGRGLCIDWGSSGGVGEVCNPNGSAFTHTPMFASATHMMNLGRDTSTSNFIYAMGDQLQSWFISLVYCVCDGHLLSKPLPSLPHTEKQADYYLRVGGLKQSLLTSAMALESQLDRYMSEEHKEEEKNGVGITQLLSGLQKLVSPLVEADGGVDRDKAGLSAFQKAIVMCRDFLKKCPLPAKKPN